MPRFDPRPRFLPSESSRRTTAILGASPTVISGCPHGVVVRGSELCQAPSRTRGRFCPTIGHRWPLLLWTVPREEKRNFPSRLDKTRWARFAHTAHNSCYYPRVLIGTGESERRGAWRRGHPSHQRFARTSAVLVVHVRLPGRSPLSCLPLAPRRREVPCGGSRPPRRRGHASADSSARPAPALAGPVRRLPREPPRGISRQPRPTQHPPPMHLTSA
jgi:hypothetical protein